ncbi:MAG: 50S ribosomal protein L10 [Candidatus Uhrbacteria bacterium GW2011_GWE2_40_58]|nr:MAG: 50S ribosomal protein L10 [Candidatus Uhrbacteria bacterium GW2011_GWE2_40_58]
MPKTREQKKQMIQELADKFGKMKSAVFTSISGYTVEDATALRSTGHKKGVELMVTKKTLLLQALKEKGLETSKDTLEGSILTAIGYEDEIAPAKIIADFVKGREGITIVGGVIEGAFVGANSIIQLSTLPSKQELLAKLVGSMNAPTSGFVNALAGNLRNLVYVLTAVKEQKPNS